MVPGANLGKNEDNKMTTTTKSSIVRVWGLGDWANYYGPVVDKLESVEKILMSPCPFHKNKLVGDTHFAFLGISAINGAPLTVATWIDLHPADGQPKFYFSDDPWHTGQLHTDLAILQHRIYIMLREIVPGSTSKTFQEQVAMLPREYKVPTTIEEVTKDILVFRKTGKRCNGSRWAACWERTVQTSRVCAGNVSCVGSFDATGLRVDYWDGRRNDYLGVGASRKILVD